MSLSCYEKRVQTEKQQYLKFKHFLIFRLSTPLLWSPKCLENQHKQQHSHLVIFFENMNFTFCHSKNVQPKPHTLGLLWIFDGYSDNSENSGLNNAANCRQAVYVPFSREQGFTMKLQIHLKQKKCSEAIISKVLIQLWNTEKGDSVVKCKQNYLFANMM